MLLVDQAIFGEGSQEWCVRDTPGWNGNDNQNSDLRPIYSRIPIVEKSVNLPNKLRRYEISQGKGMLSNEFPGGSGC